MPEAIQMYEIWQRSIPNESYWRAGSIQLERTSEHKAALQLMLDRLENEGANVLGDYLVRGNWTGVNGEQRQVIRHYRVKQQRYVIEHI